jgi:PQQ-dependent dehydrogenase (methanol/ethanol family)
MADGGLKRGRFVLWLGLAAGVGLVIALATGAFSSKEAQISAPNAGTTVVETTASAGATPFGAGDWGTYGGTYDMWRHSPLTEITKDNVKELGLAFSVDFRTIDRTIPRGQQSFPIVIDGIIYVTTGYSHVFAIDGRSGKVIWHYKPSDTGTFKNFGLSANRGVAVCDGKVFVLTLDMRIISIDIEDGTQIRSRFISETVPGADVKAGYSETMAPVCYDNTVLIGASGSDAGARGFVMAYHTDLTPAWSTPYWTVPPWGQDWRSLVSQAGGGTAWNPATIDPSTGLMYITTSHPSPLYFPELRPGSNARTNSLIALDFATGRQRWWRQQLAADQWGYGTQQPAAVYDVEIDGRDRRVVSVATKEGYWFSYDAATGEPIYERVRVVNQVEHPPLEPGKPVLVFPGSIGGVNYSPGSYDPGTGYVINSQAETSLVLIQKEREDVLDDLLAGDLETGLVNGPFGTLPDGSHDFGSVAAINASTGVIAWKKIVAEPGRGGVTTTASGIAFVGGGDGLLQAYDTLTGSILWQFQTGYQIASGPSIYEIDGRQFIAITTGGTPSSSFGGTASRLEVFALGESTTQPIAPEIRDQGLPIGDNDPLSTAFLGLSKDSRTLTFQAVASEDDAGDRTIDGYRDGTLVVTVPRDWIVNITYRNALSGSDGLLVTGLTGSTPSTGGVAAFAGAETDGEIAPGGVEYVSFRAIAEGEYAIASTTSEGVGAWVKLIVGPPNTIPSITRDGETFLVDVTR